MMMHLTTKSITATEEGQARVDAALAEAPA